MESIYDGTWASGPPPPELVDFQLMRGMGGWSWEQLQATPLYVRRYCWDILQIEGEWLENQRQREAERA